MKFNPLLLALIGFSIFCPVNGTAENNQLKLFKTGSYRQILETHKNQPFVLIIWSLTCSSCLKDMENLDTLHKNNPRLELVMLSTDELSDTENIEAMLEQHHLADVENWVFADENTQKLRFEIDPSWYGEMPKTYFFDKHHHRTGVSGVLSKQEFSEHVAKITDNNGNP